MEAKPFSLQSPEKVAETYGGNKQKIAQAIQMGVIDPTSGLLAGMFIDRMRSAQMMEQAPQQSVAQQVFAPPASPQAPPGGLGAMAPQPAPVGPAPVGMAAGGMTELPEPNTPYNTNAGGGLTTLPIPDSMYDEQTFAGGGVVAFAEGGSPAQKFLEQADQLEREASDLRKYSRAEALSMRARAAELRDAAGQSTVGESTLGAIKAFGTGVGRFFTAPQGEPLVPGNTPIAAPSGYQSNLGQVNLTPYTPSALPVAASTGLGAIAPSLPPRPPAGPPPASTGSVPVPTPRPGLPTDQSAPATEQPYSLQSLTDMFAKAGELPEFQKTSADERTARKNEDLWSTLAQIGFGMAAGESPNALTNIGKATAAAVPGMQASLKERRADEKDERNREFDYLIKKAGVKGDALKSAYTVFNSMQDREQRETLERMKMEFEASENAKQRANALRVAGISSAPRPGFQEQSVAAIAQQYIANGMNPIAAKAKATNEVLVAGNPYAGLNPQRALIESQIEQASAARTRAFKDRDKQAVANADAEIKRLRTALLNLGADSQVGASPTVDFSSLK